MKVVIAVKVALVQREEHKIIMKLSKEIFRAYDIRGIVDETLTEENVRAIGAALGTQVLEAGGSSIIVGRDGRTSGLRLRNALVEGLISTGCNVVDIGEVPTPLVYFATFALKISSGVVITGSHNPANYNGLKMMIKGKALYGETILGLYDLIQTASFRKGNGRISFKEISDSYIQFIKTDIQVRRLKIVVDCGNGVAGHIAPLLYQALGCEVIPLYCEVDGRFPNHHPDPGQPENLLDLKKAVLINHADLGLAFDGDGDRLGIVDNEGNIIWPDRLLILFAKEILSRNPGAHIIFDVKCTRHVQEAVTQFGGTPLMWKTGHSFIKAKIEETGALLAGEMSGHLFFKDRWFGFDDALYAGSRLLEILSKANESSAEIFKKLPDSVNTPEILLKVSEQEKFSTVSKMISLAKFEQAEISTIDGLRVDFKDGFGLVRPSNTGPNLILRFEGDTKIALDRIKNEFRTLLQTVQPEWRLTF